MKIRDKEVVVVAELGTSYAAPTQSTRLVRLTKGIVLAADAGVDAVKVQLFVPDEPLFCPVEGDEARWQRWNQTFLSEGQWQTARQLARECGVAFIASTFQHAAIELGKKLDLDAWKVATRARHTFPYGKIHAHVGVSDRVIVSIPPDEPVGSWSSRLYLQCVSKYPTALNEASWLYGDGLSDHSGTPWPAIDALARGAKLVEVHFGDTDGPDAKVCVSFDELKMICDARDAFAAMRQG